MWRWTRLQRISFCQETVTGGVRTGSRICEAFLASRSVSVVLSALCLGGAPRFPSCVAPCVERVELIAQHVALPNAQGAAGDLWGGHQSRIVRTAAGQAFVVFTVAGASALQAEWRVARRTSRGWVIAGSGVAGREPAQLLRSPDDALWVVAWPGGLPMLSKGQITADTVRWTSARVPGPWVRSDWPYVSAGINQAGRLCLLQSVERTTSPPAVIVGCQDSTDRWSVARNQTDFRYAYSFVFPGEKSVTWVASRDDRWDRVGFHKEPVQSAWVFNAVKVFHIDSIGGPVRTVLVHEEKPTDAGDPVLTLARDAFQDEEGALHITYEARGPRTNSQFEMRYALVEGEAVKRDERVAASIEGWTDGFFRILADTRGKLFWLYNRASTELLFRLHPSRTPLADDGVALSFAGRAIVYPGLFIAVARGGNRRSDTIDTIFGSEGSLYYAALRLP